MGACVSTHHKPSAMKLQFSFASSNDNNNKLVIPPSPTKQKPPLLNADLTVKSFRHFGSKEEPFFDSKAWLESDCEDDFMSVNGEFTPSRGSTPVHHNFSAGSPQVNGNKKPPVSATQPSPSGSEKKMRLSDLFKQSLRGENEYESSEDENGMNGNAGSPLISEATSAHSSEMGPTGLKVKRVHGCFPSLLAGCRSSTNGRKKKMTPSPRLSPSPVAG